MIIDLERFIERERHCWKELETLLDRIESKPDKVPPLEDLKRFHYLYERAAAALSKIRTFSAERELRGYLDNLVARAYGEIHEARRRQSMRSPARWFTRTFPRTFRRHVRAFWLATLVLLAGAIFGGVALLVDPEAKEALVPAKFGHVNKDPRERVREEEAGQRDGTGGFKATFSASLMQNNIQVSILSMALGMTFGIGTLIVVFYNGIILGLVMVDFIRAGETAFVLGWLMPHGVIEIPAVLIGAQAGLVLAGALLKRTARQSLAARMRDTAGDLLTLITGVALMLVWAGFIESFFSQYHQPVVPYAVKIAFGTVELAALVFYLGMVGRKAADGKPGEAGR